MSDHRMIWVDVETFGLDPVKDYILEVGFVITDTELTVIDDFHALVWDSPEYNDRLSQPTLEIIQKMHYESGLWDECDREGEPVQTVTERLLGWLDAHGVGRDDPLCGSSVQFDRGMLAAQFAEVEIKFSYRNIDTSTVKELCRRFNPEVYAQLEQITKPAKAHRVLSDIRDTIEEFSFYKNHFLKVTW